jgi:hypothetical protein
LPDADFIVDVFQWEKKKRKEPWTFFYENENERKKDKCGIHVNLIKKKMSHLPELFNKVRIYLFTIEFSPTHPSLEKGVHAIYVST